MTEEHLTALLKTAEAKKDGDGWHALSEGKHMTLYVGSNGASLSVQRVEAVRQEGQIVRARTVRGEVFVLALEDVFAGAVEGAKSSNRKAGFV